MGVEKTLRETKGKWVIISKKGVGNSTEKGEQRIIMRAIGRATQKGKRVEFV